MQVISQIRIRTDDLWYMMWEVILVFHEKINLNFVILGHTNNVCDDVFGQFKRNMNLKNLLIRDI